MMARLIADAPQAQGRRRHQRSADGAGHRQRVSGPAQLEPAARHQRDRARCWPRSARRPATALDRRRPAVGPGRARAAARASASCRSPTACCSSSRCRSRSGSTHPDILGTLSVGLPARRRAGGAAQGDHRQRHRVRHGRADSRDDAAARGSAGAGGRAAHAADSRGDVTLGDGRRTSCCRCRCPPDDARRAGQRARSRSILRSRTEQLRFLRAIHTELAVTARRGRAARDAPQLRRRADDHAAAGRDHRRHARGRGDRRPHAQDRARAGSRWDDEDARLLATTFNTLTDSIARFQREMSQKERLSSLGRLSTVIAHEVRNPLMIIKAALHALRQPDARAGRAARGGRRHRRRGRAAQSHRERGARLRAADPVRAGAGRPQRALPRVGGRGARRRRAPPVHAATSTRRCRR